MVNVMFLDMALANVGVVIMGCTETGTWKHVASELVTTVKSDKKKGIRAAEDNIRRAGEVFNALERLRVSHNVVGMAAEVPTGSQNARAAELLGMAKGLLAAFDASHDDLIVEWTTPNDVKIALGGKKNATKKEMIAAAERSCPGVLKPFYKKGGGILNKAEHCADAYGIFKAVRKGPLCAMATQLAKRGNQ